MVWLLLICNFDINNFIKTCLNLLSQTIGKPLYAQILLLEFEIQFSYFGILFLFKTKKQFLIDLSFDIFLLRMTLHFIYLFSIFSHQLFNQSIGDVRLLLLRSGLAHCGVGTFFDFRITEESHADGIVNDGGELFFQLKEVDGYVVMASILFQSWL